MCYTWHASPRSIALMSRGLGRVERRVIEVLAGAADALPAHRIAWSVAGQSGPSPALEASVRRALAGLARKGYVERAGREWIHPEVRRREEREREYREQRTAEEARRREER